LVEELACIGGDAEKTTLIRSESTSGQQFAARSKASVERERQLCLLERRSFLFRAIYGLTKAFFLQPFTSGKKADRT
jgi:hypothetical protein